MVNDERLEGAARKLGGKAQGLAGDVFGDDGLKARGAFTEAQGEAEDLYGRLVDQVQDGFAELDAFIKTQPWMATLAAAAGGLFVGHVIGRAGRRVVYVRKA